MRPPLLLALALLVPALACSIGGDSEGWERTDLWILDPAIEDAGTAEEGAPPVRRRIASLGLPEVRDMSKVGPWARRRFGTQGGPQVRTLVQTAGSTIAWRLSPGREPYLSFVPLGSEGSCVGCAYTVAVREGSGESEYLYRGDVRPLSNPAPSTVTLDLERWAGREIDLLFRLVPAPTPAPEPGTALWGSPAVYARGSRPTPRETASPNVLLLGADTLRADALGAYGRAPSLTPHLDRLAEESDVWLEAFSNFNITNPSFISLLTGLYGKHHGIYNFQARLPESHTTMAELFSEAGYDTLAIIAARHLGDRTSGLAQGFDQVTESDAQFSAEVVADMAMDWIDERQSPFFAWLHFFDPHTPHAPPEPYASGLRPSRVFGLEPVTSWLPFRELGHRAYKEPVLAGHEDLYDGDVAYLDRHIGRLLDFLRSRKLLENTVVAFVSDHGENLGEHELFCHHAGLWDTTTHVPLMIRWPGREREGRRLSGLVQTLDLFPTLLAAAGIEAPAQDGVDLRELTGDGGRGRRAVFSEHAHELGVAVRTRTHRYFDSVGHSLVPPGTFLYDLERDPAEEKDVAGEQPETAERLAGILERWQGDVELPSPEPVEGELSQEDIEHLRGLGYLD